MLSKAKSLEYEQLYKKLLEYPEENLPVWVGYLASFLNVSNGKVKNILSYFDATDIFLGSIDVQKKLLHERMSLKSKEREASRSVEYKEQLRKHLSIKGRQQYDNLSLEEKKNYRNRTFLNNWTPEKEEQRRQSISITESNKTIEEKNEIKEKRKATLASKSEEEVYEMRKKQSESLKNTLSKLSEEERLLRNKKTGEGRKKAYEKESPEHRRKTAQKISDTCWKKYKVKWFTLCGKIRNSGRMRSNINKKIEEYLQANNIKYETEFIIDNRSYDFKIGNYLIEIDPSATHNVDWVPFGDQVEKKLDVNYHKNKTELAIKNNYICLHIFDWMNLSDYLLDILENNIYLEKDKMQEYYYDLKNCKLVTEEDYTNCEDKKIVKIIGDGYKICKRAK